MQGKYYLYRRTVRSRGRKIRAWYYWYYDGNGKRIRKSCGNPRAPCLLKKEAEAVIAELEEIDSKKVPTDAVRIRDVAESMYKPDGNHMKLRSERGEALDDTTLTECRGYIENYILPVWGDMRPSDVDPAQVEDWLISMDRSNSWRNRLIEIFTEIFRECVRYKIIPTVPVITKFRRKSRRQSVLSTDELRLLFPDDAAELKAIWSNKNKVEPEEIPLMFGALFCLMVSTGLRSGEARAIGLDQIDRIRGGLIIDRSLNSNLALVYHLKKGSDEDPRYRAVIIPDRAMKILDLFIEERTPCDSGFLFSYIGRPIRKEHLQARLAVGLHNVGIDTSERRITPHALRYTYNTRMRRLIPGEALRMMIGHRGEEMTDYYTRAELADQLNTLTVYKDGINQFWA